MNVCNSNSKYYLVNKETNEVTTLVDLNAVRDLVFSRLDMAQRGFYKSRHPKNLSMDKRLEKKEETCFRYEYSPSTNEIILIRDTELVPYNNEVILTSDGKIFNYMELCYEYFAQGIKDKIKYGRGYTYTGPSEVPTPATPDRYRYSYNTWAKPHWRSGSSCHAIFPTRVLSKTEKGQIRNQTEDIIDELDELNIDVDEQMVAKALSLRDRSLCYTSRSYDTIKSWKEKKKTRQWMKRRRKNNTVRPMTPEARAKLETEMYNATIDNRSILPIIPFEE